MLEALRVHKLEPSTGPQPRQPLTGDAYTHARTLLFPRPYVSATAWSLLEIIAALVGRLMPPVKTAFRSLTVGACVCVCERARVFLCLRTCARVLMCTRAWVGALNILSERAPVLAPALYPSQDSPPSPRFLAFSTN